MKQIIVSSNIKLRINGRYYAMKTILNYGIIIKILINLDINLENTNNLRMMKSSINAIYKQKHKIKDLIYNITQMLKLKNSYRIPNNHYNNMMKNLEVNFINASVTIKTKQMKSF